MSPAVRAGGARPEPRRAVPVLRIVAHIAVAVVVGPPLAAVIFLMATGLMRFGPAVLDHIGPTFGLAITPYSWLIAIVPAFVVGLIDGAALLVLRRQGPRLLLAPVVGGLAFPGFLTWLAEDETTGVLDFSTLGALGVAGALATLICVALVESFGRDPDVP
jgi:hypothetical protein